MFNLKLSLCINKAGRSQIIFREGMNENFLPNGTDKAAVYSIDHSYGPPLWFVINGFVFVAC